MSDSAWRLWGCQFWLSGRLRECVRRERYLAAQVWPDRKSSTAFSEVFLRIDPNGVLLPTLLAVSTTSR